MSMNLTEYFATSAQNVAQFETIEHGDNSAPKDEVLSGELMQRIKTHLEQWVEEKKYLQKGITIYDASREVRTNRTYLSKYINTVHKCSFRVWVTQMRIEEAKRMLASQQCDSINNIANTIGFASVESFTHIFTRVVGTSPSKWREEQS